MAEYQPYEPTKPRLKVETTFAEGDVRDHRDGFTQRESFRNMQSKDDADTEDTPAGFPPMKSCIQGTKPKAETKQVSLRKTKKVQSVMDANTKDLKTRNIK